MSHIYMFYINSNFLLRYIKIDKSKLKLEPKAFWKYFVLQEKEE